jgi:acetone carboxylase gamma subunit
MIRRLREYLEVYTGPEGDVIRCGRCGHTVCRDEDDWVVNSRINVLPPTEAGPYMIDLVGHFVLRQICCPSCGVLFDTRFVANNTPTD